MRLPLERRQFTLHCLCVCVPACVCACVQVLCSLLRENIEELDC